MIKIEGLSKKYDDREVLSDIYLEVPPGEIHGLIGMSGAGKSTVLRSINGIEEFDGGDIKISGKSIKNLDSKETLEIRKEIGMIFQNFALLERKNVFENVALPLKCWNYSKDDIDEKVKYLLELVGIEDKIYDMPRNLSGGQRQRVAIARALALEPKILLSDEATSGLDPVTTNNILNLLLDINKNLGITIVLVTHEMEVIKRICDNMSILEDGEVVATGRVEDLFSRFNEHLIKLVGNIDFNISVDETVFKAIIYSDHNSKRTKNFLSELEDNIEFNVEKVNIEELKNGKLEEYYISIKNKDLERTKKYLESLDYVEYRFIQEVLC